MTLTNESSTPAESTAVPAAPALCCAACQPGMPQHAQRDSSLLARWHLLTQASAVPASTPAHTYIHLHCRAPAGTIVGHVQLHFCGLATAMSKANSTIRT